MPGSAGSRRSPPIASSGRSSGASTGFRRTATATRSRGAPPLEQLQRVGRGRHGGHRRLLHAAADARLHAVRSVAGGRAAADVSDGAADAACREQHRLLPLVRSARRTTRAPRAAVLVLPQWNADADGHVGLCRLLNWNGMSALRLSLPYHDQRMPPELHRADYIVSANVARTVQVCRQAVLDARRAIAWLAAQGYERIGILGTSLGSCLALLTTAHEPLIRAEALNHISPYFADVVWRGLSTEHVRQGLDGHIELDDAARAVEADQPALVSRSAARSAHAARLRAVRPDVSGRSLAGSGAGVPRADTSRTSSRCCRAATTAPARRRSNTWTDGSCRGS